MAVSIALGMVALDLAVDVLVGVARQDVKRD
jgi:hypothetical protein